MASPAVEQKPPAGAHDEEAGKVTASAESREGSVVHAEATAAPGQEPHAVATTTPPAGTVHATEVRQTEVVETGAPGVVKPKARRVWKIPVKSLQDKQARRAGIIGGILLGLLLLVGLIAVACSTTTPETPSSALGTTNLPTGAHRLGADEMNRACTWLYGAGSTASYVQNSGPVPSYWIKCNGSQDLGVEEWCNAMYGTHADNPYRYETNTSLKPWDWWYCQ